MRDQKSEIIVFVEEIQPVLITVVLDRHVMHFEGEPVVILAEPVVNQRKSQL